MRRAAKVDSVQNEIVEGLREWGYHVEIIGRPVDLLVGYHWHTEAPDGMIRHMGWKLLEVKTPTKAGKRRKRKDQEDQDDFIAWTGTPVVTSLHEALVALKAE